MSVEQNIDPFAIGVVTGARWHDKEKTCIECYATFPNHPNGLTQPLPFIAHPDDCEPHGKALFYNLRQGKYGPIGDYVPPTDDELAYVARGDRDDAIKSTQWLVDRHRDEQDAGGVTTLTADDFKALQTYRQALRVLTDQAGFPRSITWPNKPAFV